MDRRKLNRDSLRALSVPSALIEEFLELDALCLDRPAPTEELVRATLDRCQEALRAFQPVKGVVPKMLSFPWQTEPVPELAQFVGALNSCVAALALPFARSNPLEPAVLFVDNHAVIKPERWTSNPFLVMLHHAYRGVDDALESVSATPIERLIVLKQDIDAYNEKDLRAIRKALKEHTTKGTYLVAAKDAGPFEELDCTVVANEIVFEIEKGKQPDSIIVKTPEGIRDSARATEICRMALELKLNAFRVYKDGTLNPRLKDALQGKSNKPLRGVLKSIG